MLKKIFKLTNFFLEYVPKKRKIRLKALIFLTTLSSILEFISIGAVVPLISTLLNLQISFFGFGENYNMSFLKNDENFKLIIFLLFIFLIILSATFRLLVLKFNLKTSSLICADLGSRVYKNCLEQN